MGSVLSKSQKITFVSKFVDMLPNDYDDDDDGGPVINCLNSPR
jgi:hypothetical protein